MTLDIDYFTNVQRTGTDNSWTVKCPAHDDRHNSLRTMSTINFARARQLLFRPGHLLQEIKSHKKREFVVTPGGPVTESVAKKILEHPLCREVDAGHFRELLSHGLSTANTMTKANDSSPVVPHNERKYSYGSKTKTRTRQ
jgi:hypothetical protein